MEAARILIERIGSVGSVVAGKLIRADRAKTLLHRARSGSYTLLSPLRTIRERLTEPGEIHGVQQE